MDLNKRMDEIAEAIIKEIRKQHENAPFMIVHPWELYEDRYRLEIYDNGKAAKPKRFDQIPWEEVLHIMFDYSDDITVYFNQSHCTEWTYTLQYPRLTEEGKELYRQEMKEKGYEGIEEMHNDQELWKLIESIPENVKTSVGRMRKTAERWKENG